jgi:dynein heavy chain
VAQQLLKNDANFPRASTVNQDLLIDSTAAMCQVVHTTAASMAEVFEAALKRKVYTTPKSYLDLIKLYQQALVDKRAEMIE